MFYELIYSIYSQLDALKEQNAALRYSISEVLLPKPAGRELYEIPIILAHTPHFLDKPDRSGMMSSLPTMSAYKSSGVF